MLNRANQDGAPNGWKTVRLDTVARRGSGHTPDKKRPEYWGGAIRWISLKDSDALDRLYVEETAERITEAGIANSSAVLHPSGTVVLSRDAGIGKSAIMKSAMAVSQHFIAWQCGKSLDNRFLYYWLQFRKGEFERIAAGNTIKTIGLQYFRDLEIPLPPIAEQKAIADRLVEAEALCNALTVLIAKKRDLKQAAMQQLLTGQVRLRGLDSPLRTIALGDLVQIRKGELITASGVVPGNIPVIAAGRAPAYFHARANRCGPTITVSASGASAGYVAFHREPIFASDCSTIGEGPGYALAFIYYQLQSKQDEIYRAQTGGAQPHVHRFDLSPLMLSVPDLAEQALIAGILEDFDKDIGTLEALLEKAKALKQGMMQELLTGRTRLV